MKGTFGFPAIGFARNVIIFGVDISSSPHTDNKKKYISILGKGPTQRLEHAVTAEKMFSINFTEHNFCLTLHCELWTEVIKFKAKDSEIAATLLYLGNGSKDLSKDNMKKTQFYGYVCDFSVDYEAIAVNDVLDIQKYLIKKHDIK